jgi:hypothetical protein
MSASPSSPEGLVEVLRQIIALFEGEEALSLSAETEAAKSNADERDPHIFISRERHSDRVDLDGGLHPEGESASSPDPTN